MLAITVFSEITVDVVHVVDAPLEVVGLFPAHGQLVSDAFREVCWLCRAEKSCLF